MPIKYINTGSSPNKGDGDTLRTAFNKINDTFAYLNIATGIQGSADLTGELFSNNIGTYGITSIYNSTASTISLRLNPATPTRIGGIKVGSGLSISPDGTLQTVTAAYVLPHATTSTLGGIVVGDNLTIDGAGRLSGVNSYVLPPATTADLGGIIVGTNLEIAEDGTLTATTQSNQQLYTTSSVTFQNITLPGTGGDEHWESVTLLLHGNDFIDYSSHPQIINETGVVIDNSVKKFNDGSYAFNSNDQISGPNLVANFDRLDFTVDGQFYFASNNIGYQPLMSNVGTADYQGWMLFLNVDNTLTLFASRNDGVWNYQLTTTYTPPTNEWVHIAIDRKVDFGLGDTLTLYVNGTPLRSIPCAEWKSPTNHFYLGYYPFYLGNTVHSFSGNIDEVRITIGVARYQGNTFSVPTHPYPNYGYSPYPGKITFGDNTEQTTAWTGQTIPTDISQLTDTQNLLLQAGSVWELSSGTRHVSLSNTGGLILADPFPVSFTALLLPVYGGGTNGPYGGDAWSFNVTFNNNSGVVTTTVDNIFPILNNPGYKNGDSWSFTQADHGIPGYTFTLTLSNVVHPGGAGWTANVSVSPPPNVNQVPVLGFPDGTIQTTAWTGLGGGSVVQSDTAPAASTSTIWYDTVGGRTYVYFDGNWVDANPAPATVDLSTVTQSIIPSEDSVYDLGSADKQWKSLYVSTNTIYVGNVPLTVDTATNTLLVNGSQVSGSGGSATTSTLVNNGYTLSVDDAGVVTFPAFIGSPSLVTIQSTSTGVDLNVTGRHWTFGADGGLTFPLGDGIFDRPGIDTGFNIRSNNASSPIYLYTYGTDGDGTGAGNIYINPTNVEIYSSWNAGGAGEKKWTFGNDGSLTFPSGAGFGAGESGQLKVNDGGTLSLDIRDNYGRGFYTNGDGFSLRGNGSNTWKFGTTGILTFPNNSTFDGQNLIDHATGVNYTLKIANGGVAGSKFGIGTGDSTFGIANDALNQAEDGYVPYSVTAQRINLTVLGAGSWVFDDTGNLTVPGDIKSAAGVGPVVIQSNDGTLRTWTFGGDGNITFPDTSVQTTAWTGTVAYSNVTGTPNLSGYALSSQVSTLQITVNNLTNTVSTLTTTATVQALIANSLTTLTSLSVNGNVSATKFIGDGSSLTNITLNQAGNIIGTQTNVTLIAGTSTYLFDNTGTLTLPYNGDIVMTGTNANLIVGGSITLASNNSPLKFTTTSGNTVSFIQQNDDNFVMYSTNSSGGQRSVWSIFANSTTSNLTVSVPTTINSSLTVTGNITMPNRPAFRVYGAGTTNNLSTTVNTNGILNGNNFAVDYNQGSYLSTSTGVFTAPIAGLYSVHLVARVTSNTTSSAQVCVIKNYATSAVNQVFWETPNNPQVNHFGVSTISKLEAGDTLVVKVTLGTINFDINDSWSVAYIG